MHTKTPCLSPGGVLLVALSLSIGWGIRGNYGHETGAMFPGALAAMAVCLVSGRSDWQDRVAYFGLFGMLGWAFGGSMSYMQVIGYTHSGHEPSQLYGFAVLFLLGFLWAALGGAGTAIPAVMSRARLNDLFKPTAFLVAIWVVLYFAQLPLMMWIQRRLELHGIADPSQRQEQGLYWLDSDWFQVAIVLCGILIYDLISRRFAKLHWLLLFGGLGAIIGYALHHFVLAPAGATAWMETHLIQPQGDLSMFPAEKLAVSNWPPIVLFYREQLGWFIGLLVGVAAYFIRFGEFRHESSLYLHMAVGWFVGFLALPVFGSLFLGEYGGLRLTPPRGDNWAGVLGTLLGAITYFLRRDLRPVALASLVCGTIGGIGFSGIAWLKMLMLALGNPNVTRDASIREMWAAWQQSGVDSYANITDRLPVDATWNHYQSANWHSFLEQSYGFVNGIGVAVALGLLATRVPKLDDSAPRKSWTTILSITLILPVLTFVNTIKNIADWSPREATQPHLLPSTMRAPWFEQMQLTSWGWFSLFFALATAAMVVLMIAHVKRPLAIIPSTWLGRGQLLYFLLLWAFVLANFTKALAGFAEGRLLTEGVILLNADVVTVLVLILPQHFEPIALAIAPNYRRLIRGALVVMLLIASVLPFVETYSIRAIYGDALVQRIGPQYFNFRFGPRANWRHQPLLKGEKHE